MITENGEGLPNSNSYATLVELIDYCQDRDLNALLLADPAVQARCLVRATDFIDATYVFRSVRLSDTQALECPRFGEDSISARLKAATIELAVIALTQDLFAIPTRGLSATETQVGKIITKKTFDAAPVGDPYPHVTKMLRSIAARRGSKVQIGMMTR